MIETVHFLFFRILQPTTIVTHSKSFSRPGLQCDQIGLFLKSLRGILCYKINSNIGQLFVQF